MLPDPLRAYLDGHRVAYRVLAHAPRFTAQETAAIAHVSGKRFAKVVLLEGRDRDGPPFLLAVLPANEEVDVARLGKALGRPVALADESDFVRLCPEFEPGAAPPFGDLSHLPVFVDRGLRGVSAIVFNGGNHTDLVEMGWREFEELAKPRMLDYGRPPVAPEPAARTP